MRPSTRHSLERKQLRRRSRCPSTSGAGGRELVLPARRPPVPTVVGDPGCSEQRAVGLSKIPRSTINRPCEDAPGQRLESIRRNRKLDAMTVASFVNEAPVAEPVSRKELERNVSAQCRAFLVHGSPSAQVRCR